MNLLVSNRNPVLIGDFVIDRRSVIVDSAPDRAPIVRVCDLGREGREQGHQENPPLHG